IFLIDGKGTIEFANHWAEDMFGYSREELIHQSYEALVPDGLRAIRKEQRPTMRDPKARNMDRNVELFARRKNGVEFPADVSISPVRMNSDMLYTVIVRDISDRKKLETER